MTAKTNAVFPLPGTYQDQAIFLTAHDFMGSVADFFEADEDDVNSVDVYWGGEHSDENSTEILIVRGEVVGSTDLITRDDWRALLDNADNVSRARIAAIPQIA